MRRSANGKTTQTERVYAAIKNAIVQGEIEEGSFLSEAQIMSRYDVGRTPYREACNRLHHEGLLQIVPHQGFLVPEMSFHTVCELFELRLILEDAVAQLATARATDKEILELEKLAVTHPKSMDAEHTIVALVQANLSFHLALARSTRNRRLVELLRQNLESTERLMYLELRSSGFREPEFRSCHERIVDALKKRDGAAVRQAVWDDITAAQGATVSGRNLQSLRSLLDHKDDTAPGRGQGRRGQSTTKSRTARS